MQNLKNILLGGCTRVVTVLIVPLQQIQYLLLGSPVTGNCSSGRLYAVQFQEIPGIQHVDGCFPVQVTMVRVRIGRLFKEKSTREVQYMCSFCIESMYVWKSAYVHAVKYICTSLRVHIHSSTRIYFLYICTYIHSVQ